MSEAPEAVVTAGYTLVLPEGWVRLPLRDEQECARLVGLLAAQAAQDADLAPDQRVRVRAAAQGRLEAAVRDARAQGGLDLHLPTAPLGGLLLPVSIVVAEPVDQELVSLTDTHGGPPDPVAVLAALLSRSEGGQAVEVDGAAGMRREGPAARPPGAQGPGSTVVEHVLAVPGAPGRWLTLTASVLDVDDPEVGGLLLDLVDAVVSTFRWTRTPAPAPEAGTLSTGLTASR